MSQRLPPIHSTPKQQKTQNSFNLGLGASSGLGDISFQQKSKSSYSPYSPHTFMLNSEVQNNYSAYRLNNNMRIAANPSQKKVRVGFFGEVYNMDAHNQPINNAGGYNSYTNPQYNKHPYQQGYPGHYGNPMMAFQPPQQMDLYAMPQNPLMARPNVQIPNFSRNFSTNHAGYQPGDIHAMTDRGPNTTRLMPLDQTQITRNTRYNPDGSQFRDIRTQNIQRNNMSVHNQTIYYSSPTTMVNVEDDMQILKTVLVSPKEGLPNQTMILGNQTALHTTNNTMILDQTRLDSEGPEKLNRTKSSLKKSKLTKKGSEATAKSVHYSNSTGAGGASDAGVIGSGGKPNLKALLWTIVYPRLWMKDVDSKVEIRRDGVFNEVNQCISILGDVIQSQCGDALNAIYNEKKSMVLVSGEEKSVLSGAKELSAKEITQRSALVIPKVEALFQSLHKLVSEYVLPTPVMKFLGTLSGYKGAPPQLFFTDFEIARMQFTNIGTIADMEPLRSKMIIGVLILVRTLGYTLLMKPWDTVKGLKKKSELVKNLKTVGSVVYHIVMDYFRVTVPPIPNNQAHLPVEKRLKSRKGGPIVAFEEELNNEGDMKTFVKEEVIIGIYSKRKLKDFFNANQAAVESLQAKIEEWLDAMYELIIKVYTQERKKEAS